MDVETRRVLVVDDDDDLRHALSYLLSDAGYIVDEAADGRRALERLACSRDGMVVLLDLQRPVLDGVEVMRAVIAHKYLARRHTYVLMTVDHAWFPPLFLTVLDELRVPILAKPFDIFRTLDVVRLAEQRLKTGA